MAGVGGMLGEAFYQQFKGEYELKCSDIDVNEEWLSYLDFRGARGLNTARDPWNGWPIPLDSRKRGIYSSYRRPNVNLNIHRIEY